MMKTKKLKLKKNNKCKKNNRVLPERNLHELPPEKPPGKILQEIERQDSKRNQR